MLNNNITIQIVPCNRNQIWNFHNCFVLSSSGCLVWPVCVCGPHCRVSKLLSSRKQQNRKFQCKSSRSFVSSFGQFSLITLGRKRKARGGGGDRVGKLVSAMENQYQHQLRPIQMSRIKAIQLGWAIHSDTTTNNNNYNIVRLVLLFKEILNSRHTEGVFVYDVTHIVVLFRVRPGQNLRRVRISKK